MLTFTEDLLHTKPCAGPERKAEEILDSPPQKTWALKSQGLANISYGYYCKRAVSAGHHTACPAYYHPGWDTQSTAAQSQAKELIQHLQLDGPTPTLSCRSTSSCPSLIQFFSMTQWDTSFLFSVVHKPPLLDKISKTSWHLRRK